MKMKKDDDIALFAFLLKPRRTISELKYNDEYFEVLFLLSLTLKMGKDPLQKRKPFKALLPLVVHAVLSSLGEMACVHSTWTWCGD